MGPSWLAYRIFHAVQQKTGYFRWALPARPWSDQPLATFLRDAELADTKQYGDYRRTSAPCFFFRSESMRDFQHHFHEWDTPKVSPISVAEELIDGTARYFSCERVHVGATPDWHCDPFSGSTFPNDRHWSQIGDFGAVDIKLAWELNRFGFTYDLVRAYWRTNDERYPELFWKLVESWHGSNPPQMGINWKCGQEISLRVMAWCFGFYGFANSLSTTDARIAMLAQMIAVSGQRIEFHIDYALSQKNNHGISEATGLWTIGQLFPEFQRSSIWSRKGRNLLEQQAAELIYADGSFSQHSMNYHRVMLQNYLWSIRLGDLSGQPFSDALHDRIERAVEFIAQLQDETSGQVPQYGHNDGALILPLDNCDYWDFRPLVQAGTFLINGRHRFEAGPWNEDLLWLFGFGAVVKSRAVEPAPTSDFAPNKLTASTHTSDDGGGYMVLRSASGMAVTRAAQFRHRPAHADMLHVDLWWRGLNIATDPGTFSYNAVPPWNNSLASTACHNTVVVDDRNQMDAASRFLWLPWLTGTSFGECPRCHGDVNCWNGEHDGYTRAHDPIVHRRGLVRLGSDHWLVVDSLSGLRSHSYQLHWLLSDGEYDADATQKTIELQTVQGTYRLAVSASSMNATWQIVRASTSTNEGWRSNYYHTKEPAISVNARSTGTRVVFATVLGPHAQPATIDGHRVSVIGPDWQAHATLDLSRTSGAPLISTVMTIGSLAETESENPREQVEIGLNQIERFAA